MDLGKCLRISGYPMRWDRFSCIGDPRSSVSSSPDDVNQSVLVVGSLDQVSQKRLKSYGDLKLGNDNAYQCH